MYRIRPPSKTLNKIRPTEAPKSANSTVPAGLEAAESYSVAFLSCLNALTEEVKRNSKFTRRLKLVNGERQDIHSGIYTFVLDEDEQIFEGSRVQVHIKSKTYSAAILKVTNLTPKILYLEIDGNPGKVIDVCEIQQDEAALYEALAERYSLELGIKAEKSKSKVGSDFSFADRVIENNINSIDHKISAISTDLNSDQYKFIKKALGHDISYLWGPPGTGKTKCLGGLITSLYDASERSIIASNTNQAVDQVLLKLCRDLKNTGREEELLKGKIIREGPIHNSELKREFGKYLEINSITKILAAPLNKDLNMMTDEILGLKQQLKSLPKLKEKIERLDYWTRQIDNLEMQKKDCLSQFTFTTARCERLSAEYGGLETELNSIGSRGVIKSIFGKSRKTLERELTSLAPQLLAANKEVKRDRLLLDNLDEKLIINKEEVSSLLKLTGGVNMSQLEAKTNAAAKRLRELHTSVRNLRKKLNDLSETIIQDASVIGATLTRLFLVPSKIGKCENLIIDEASTAILPAVHFASSLSKKRVILSGDFRQLPPIVETKNKHIQHVLGNNIFLYSRRNQTPIADLFEQGNDIPNAHMLEWQYRMPHEICELLSNFAYNGMLKTAPILGRNETKAPEAFANPITVLDTSAAGCYCDITASGSRHNTFHALIAARIAKMFLETSEHGTIGYCSPYRAQSDLTKRIFSKSGLGQDVTAGTVHVFQGDEKDTMIFDTVDGLGAAKTAGAHISKDKAADAQLLNVAISRARQRIVIIANLKLLDRTLPGLAFLRQILAKAQSGNAVICSSSILGLEKIEKSAQASLIVKHEKVSALLNQLTTHEAEIKQTQKELRALQDSSHQKIYVKLQSIKKREKDLELRDQKIQKAEKTAEVREDLIHHREVELEASLKGLHKNQIDLKKQLLDDALTFIDGKDFISIFKEGLKAANQSVVIYSGFASANRVLNLLDIFKETIARGVKIRVVVKYHKKDPWFFTKDGNSAVHLLRKIGVIVDLRAEIHQKAVLIDNEVIFFGSANPLSYNEEKSDETMTRIIGIQTPLDFANKVALHGEKSLRTVGDLVRSENPNCKHCGSDTEFTRYRGKKFICIECGLHTPFGKGLRKR